MKNNRLQVIGTILLDSSFLLYFIVFSHDLTLSIPDIKEWITIILVLIFSVYTTFDTFKKIILK
ncbi:MAG: hypothetical protein PWR19_1723 [Carnobacterium sp.]|jgi:hypothetical protein|nr:hypothetical protein [Carnobacterium sp.]